MNKFIEFYQMVKPQIKDRILDFNNEIKKEKNTIIKDNIEAFCLLNESGKMVRGTLTTLGYYFFNNDFTYALPLACAYEVFETSILVHDDIIDNDLLRRNQKTITAFNDDKYGNFKNKHFSESIAICMGDYGIHKANELIINHYGKDKNFSKLFKTYNDIVIDTIRGELIDVITPFEEKNSLFKYDVEKNVMEIYTLKTAWYSIVGPIILGMILANSKDNMLNEIIDFALPLGIAFQIQDDLLGIYAESQTIGKKAGNDIREFKQTLLYAYTKNTPYYKDLLKEYGKENYNLDKVQKIFEECGAKDYCIKRMNELYVESTIKLSNIKWLSDTHRKILIDLIEYLKNREK